MSVSERAACEPDLGEPVVGVVHAGNGETATGEEVLSGRLGEQDDADQHFLPQEHAIRAPHQRATLEQARRVLGS